MAKTQKKQSSSPGPLRRSFEKKKPATPKKKQTTAPSSSALAAPTRQQTSGFLSYLHSTKKSTCQSTAEEALKLHQHYHSLEPHEKKALIQQFYVAGGKRQGLSSCFSQKLSNSARAADRAWRGYVTPEKLIELFGVLQGVKQTTNTHWTVLLTTCLSPPCYIEQNKHKGLDLFFLLLKLVP